MTDMSKGIEKEKTIPNAIQSQIFIMMSKIKTPDASRIARVGLKIGNNKLKTIPIIIVNAMVIYLPQKGSCGNLSV